MDKMLNINGLLLKILIFSMVFLLTSCKIFKTKKEPATTHRHEKVEIKTKDIYSSLKANQLIELARNYTGVPYKMGGTNAEGMDCSGLIYTVTQTAGLVLPRISHQQAEIGQEVNLENIQQGDLVFFNTAKNTNRISHVGLVTEANYPEKIIFIHSSTSKGVREDNLFSEYWKKAFVKATRPFVF